MNTDSPLPHADPADVAEQQQDVVPSVDGEGVPDLEADQVPLEADEADVNEQRTEVPSWGDDDVDET